MRSREAPMSRFRSPTRIRCTACCGARWKVSRSCMRLPRAWVIRGSNRLTTHVPMPPSASMTRTAARDCHKSRPAAWSSAPSLGAMRSGLPIAGGLSAERGCSAFSSAGALASGAAARTEAGPAISARPTPAMTASIRIRLFIVCPQAACVRRCLRDPLPRRSGDREGSGKWSAYGMPNRFSCLGGHRTHSAGAGKRKSDGPRPKT
jgi:hypothetical protein